MVWSDFFLQQTEQEKKKGRCREKKLCKEMFWFPKVNTGDIDDVCVSKMMTRNTGGKGENRLKYWELLSQAKFYHFITLNITAKDRPCRGQLQCHLKGPYPI